MKTINFNVAFCWPQLNTPLPFEAVHYWSIMVLEHNYNSTLSASGSTGKRVVERLLLYHLTLGPVQDWWRCFRRPPPSICSPWCFFRVSLSYVLGVICTSSLHYRISDNMKDVYPARSTGFWRGHVLYLVQIPQLHCGHKYHNFISIFSV